MISTLTVYQKDIKVCTLDVWFGKNRLLYYVFNSPSLSTNVARVYQESPSHIFIHFLELSFQLSLLWYSHAGFADETDGL